MASEFKHNKRRNSGLAYEFLVRRLATAMIDQDVRSAAKATAIVREYFSPGTPLSSERELFRTIIETRGVTAETARQILDRVTGEAAGMDPQTLDIKKSNLLKEVHHTFGKSFYDDFRLPQYKLYASIQIYLDGCRGSSRLSESVKKILLQEGIVKWMTTTGDPTPEFRREPEIDGIVTTIAAKKFEERYGSEFSPRQRELLEAYSRALLKGELDTVAQKMHEDKREIVRVLREGFASAEIKKDRVMSDKLNEALHRLMGTNVSRVSDEKVEEMLLYWKLAEELASNG